MQYQIIKQANRLFSVYTDTDPDSMANEDLIAFDLSESEADNLLIDLSEADDGSGEVPVVVIRKGR